MHVAADVEQLGRERAKSTVKRHLAEIRMLFDRLVTGQAMPSDPDPSGQLWTGGRPLNGYEELGPDETGQLVIVFRSANTSRKHETTRSTG